MAEVNLWSKESWLITMDKIVDSGSELIDVAFIISSEIVY